MKPIFNFVAGNTPLLINVPHSGTAVPEAIACKFTAVAAGLPDTDWFVQQLYGWATEKGAGMLSANYSRYVIDLNRPPDDAALYQRAGTRLVPDITFSGERIYQQDQAPDAAGIEQRKIDYWQPYHDKLQQELARLRQEHGHAILLDAHSILSHVPLLFEGKLPDLNLGTYRSSSAETSLIDISMQALSSHPDFTSVLDGRFQGGYITRHYGQPQKGWHALQLEMSQSVYMQEQPPAYDEQKSAKIRPVLERWLDALLKWEPVNG